MSPTACVCVRENLALSRCSAIEWNNISHTRALVCAILTAFRSSLIWFSICTSKMRTEWKVLLHTICVSRNDKRQRKELNQIYKMGKNRFNFFAGIDYVNEMRNQIFPVINWRFEFLMQTHQITEWHTYICYRCSFVTIAASTLVTISETHTHRTRIRTRTHTYTYTHAYIQISKISFLMTFIDFCCCFVRFHFFPDLWCKK